MFKNHTYSSMQSLKCEEFWNNDVDVNFKWLQKATKFLSKAFIKSY